MPIDYQNVGDKHVRTYNFNKIVDACNRTFKLYFDPNDFVTEDAAAGTMVRLANNKWLWDHFEVEKITPTSVRVHAGQWIRRLGDEATYYNTFEIKLTIDGGGTSTDSNDYKTVTGISAASTTYYMYISLDDPDDPTTLTADKNIGVPSTAMIESLRIIAKVRTNSAGKIDEIEQCHRGDVQDFWLKPHEKSMDYTGHDAASTEAHLQPRGFDDPSAAGYVATDLANDDYIMFQDVGDAALWYITWQKLADDLVSPDGPWGGTIPIPPLPGSAQVSHHALVAHNPAWPVGGGWGDYDDHTDTPYKLMLLGGTSGTPSVNYTRNKNAIAGAIVSDDNYLGNDLWVEDVLHVESADAATAVDDGAVQIDGGLSAKEGCYFDATNGHAQTDDANGVIVVYESVSGDEVRLCDGGYDVNSRGTGINTQGLFAVDGNLGRTQTSGYNLVDNSGNKVPIIVRGGIITTT